MAGQIVNKADQHRKPKIAIGFFGITRSLKWTLPSIQENIIAPAKMLGDAKLFAHLYQQTQISNPRSGENCEIDPNEYKLLGCDEVLLEPPGDCLNNVDFEWIFSRGDLFNDGGKSLSNLIHQLHSLDRLGEMIESWQPDVAVLVRPDLMYHDSFFEIIKKHLTMPSNSLTLPDWQWYGGYNDRFAVCNARSIKHYTNRISLIPRYLDRTGGPLPAERFLRFCLHQNRIFPMSMPLRASRVRANGNNMHENFKSVSWRKKSKRFFSFTITKFLLSTEP